MNEKKENVLKDKSFAFAIEIVMLCKKLSQEQKEFILSKQLIRSGTAIGALVREAQNAESRADFAHKLGIAQKECDETIYWLELLYETKYIDDPDYTDAKQKAEELLRIIRSSILTIKQRIRNS